MSLNTCWLCKIFRAEENGISSNNTEECLMTPETAIWVRLSSRNPDSISTSACWMRTSLPRSSGQRSPSHWKRVSLEEVLQWSQSFEKLVTSKYGPMIYKTYLKTEHSDENIEFWLACEAYKKITSQRKRISMARKLFTSYIQPQAPNELFQTSSYSLRSHLDATSKTSLHSIRIEPSSTVSGTTTVCLHN
ncbi:regulator of G-protein signaling 13 isoform X2 [Falco naumanni]|uniref:regulator of G-protein signaling 13 isoform X2 n=1 Tax=Falco naumanni TaxID=148594 RepID=UPI001ADE8DA0|nr:regulator of G-protein signaling 13 isoform X2 [Falco naumanni]XP_040466407.1 regulator of G-protein signaling 13 isoform X2 [Falco naumanni]